MLIVVFDSLLHMPLPVALVPATESCLADAAWQGISHRRPLGYLAEIKFKNPTMRAVD